ncbi:PH domain-containing protein [Micromonospora sp. RTP1Z1]|uniref:PH domain-containing protein n=1 Tax=Micromonospora sp. RTP1Z1 TaxID=2994043 RepID=UPI0039B3EFA1
MWRRIFHPRLSAGPEGLILRREWRTIRVPWSAVVQCDAGYYGITITCADGSRVVAPAPQKSNLSRWLGRAPARPPLRVSRRSPACPMTAQRRACGPCQSRVVGVDTDAGRRQCASCFGGNRS